jgi:hypothetical protein
MGSLEATPVWYDQAPMISVNAVYVACRTSSLGKKYAVKACLKSIFRQTQGPISLKQFGKIVFCTMIDRNKQVGSQYTLQL